MGPPTAGTLLLPEAAIYLGKSEATLRLWRRTDRGPRSFLIDCGDQTRIAYAKADLDAYRARTRQPRAIRGDVTASTDAAGGPIPETVG